MNRELGTCTLALVFFLSVLLVSCKKDPVAGADGYNSLITTSIEAVGSNCPVGGLKVDVGLDANRNGTLEKSEITKTSYLCNSTPSSYAAKLDQAGTNAPVATTVVNSLNLTITWSRLSQGYFKGVLNQNLDLNKTILLSNNIDVHCKFQSANEIALDNSCGVNARCDDFAGFYFEIRVY